MSDAIFSAVAQSRKATREKIADSSATIIATQSKRKVARRAAGKNSRLIPP